MSSGADSREKYGTTPPPPLHPSEKMWKNRIFHWLLNMRAKKNQLFGKFLNLPPMGNFGNFLDVWAEKNSKIRKKLNCSEGK